MNNVFPEEKFILDYVPNECAEKNNVRAGANWHPDIGECARARKTRIDVNDRSPIFLSFHHPAKTDRMGFGHRGSFNQDAIGAGQILLRGRSSAPAEGGAQTGHRAAMSYPGLV